MVETLLSQPAVQGAAAVVLVTLVGVFIRRTVWARHVVALGVLAYEYAEEEGILQGLTGFSKFEPFMQKFIQSYYEQYGKSPSPKAKAVAVEAMEREVIKEHGGKS